MPVGQLHTVARVEDLPGGSAVASAGDTDVAVFHCKDGFYATQAKCLRMGGPLGRRRLADCVVSCPWHGWQYDVRTGENVFDRAITLETYDVVVEDGEVKVVV